MPKLLHPSICFLRKYGEPGSRYFCVYRSTKYVTRGDAIYNMVLLEKPITAVMIATREMAGMTSPLYIRSRISKGDNSGEMSR
jgi:hypothetical protein